MIKFSLIVPILCVVCNVYLEASINPPMLNSTIPTSTDLDTLLPDQPKKERLKFFEWLTNSGKDKDYKSRWRNAIDGSPNCSFSEELSNNARWAERYPASTKVLKVVIEEACGAPTDRLLLLSRSALNNWKNDKVKTAKDDRIFIKMNKYSKQNTGTLAQAINGDLWKWLVEKEQTVTAKYEARRSKLINEKEALLRKKSTSNKAIEALKDSVSVINNSYKSKKNALKEVQTQVQQKAQALSDTTSYSIDFNVPNVEVSDADFALLKATLACLNKNEQPDEACLAALPDRLKLVLTETESCNRGIIKLNDPLGNPCPEDRANLIQEFFPLLINQLERIPKEYLEKVTVSATFTGKADLTSVGRTIKPKEVPETINTTYFNFANQSKTFDKSAGVQTITNEELAFLRAYCTYIPVRDILLKSSNNTIDIRQSEKHQVTFQAIEQQVGSKEAREDFRGGSFQICFNNLYDGIIDDIEKIKANEAQLVKEMKALKQKKEMLLDKIDEAGIEMGETDSRIDEIDVQIYNINKILNTSSNTSSNSNSSSN